MNTGERVIIVDPFGTWGKYTVGSIGTIMEKWQSLSWGDLGMGVVWNYTVLFDDGQSATVRESELTAYHEPEPEEIADFHLILLPNSTIYLTPCGVDAPDTWFNHATGIFLSTASVQRLLEWYSGEPEAVVV